MRLKGVYAVVVDFLNPGAQPPKFAGDDAKLPSGLDSFGDRAVASRFQFLEIGDNYPWNGSKHWARLSAEKRGQPVRAV